MEDYEGRVLSVAEELEVTRSGYQAACEEIAQLKEQLLAMGVLQDQHQLLQQEVGVVTWKGCGQIEGVWSHRRGVVLGCSPSLAPLPTNLHPH